MVTSSKKCRYDLSELILKEGWKGSGPGNLDALSGMGRHILNYRMWVGHTDWHDAPPLCPVLTSFITSILYLNPLVSKGSLQPLMGS